VRQLVQAHAYWRLRDCRFDLVIWNEDHAGYRQLLHDQIMGLIAAGIEANRGQSPGGISSELRSKSRARIASCSNRSLAPSSPTVGGSRRTRSIIRRSGEVIVPRLTRANGRAQTGAAALPRRDLVFFNGWGVHSDGREYVITTLPGR